MSTVRSSLCALIAAQALTDPEIKVTFAKQNIDPSPGTAEAFGALIAAERARWAQVVAKAGIKLE